MPNIAAALKVEFSRIARKESRAETETLVKANRHQRKELAALKLRVGELEKRLRGLRTSVRTAARPVADSATASIRFSAKGLAAQRKRLGLSAEEVGKLLGASGQTIYNWEGGSSKPRDVFKPALAALRTLGKKQARTVLDGRT